MWFCLAKMKVPEKYCIKSGLAYMYSLKLRLFWIVQESLYIDWIGKKLPRNWYLLFCLVC